MNITHKYLIAGRILNKHLKCLQDLASIVDSCYMDNPNLRHHQPDQFQLQPCICETEDPSNLILDSPATFVLNSWINTACNLDLISLETQVQQTLIEISSITNTPVTSLTILIVNKPSFICIDPKTNFKFKLGQPNPQFIELTSTSAPSVVKPRLSRQAQFNDTLVDDNFSQCVIASNFPRIIFFQTVWIDRSVKVW